MTARLPGSYWINSDNSLGKTRTARRSISESIYCHTEIAFLWCLDVAFLFFQSPRQRVACEALKMKGAQPKSGAPFAWMGRVTNAAAQLIEIAQIVSISATIIPVGLRFAGASRRVVTSQALVSVMLPSSFLLTQRRISVSKKATATNQTAGFEPAPIPEAQFIKNIYRTVVKKSREFEAHSAASTRLFLLAALCAERLRVTASLSLPDLIRQSKRPSLTLWRYHPGYLLSSCRQIGYQ